ncbi:MAG: hypothetical protein KDB40_06670 [Acidimicrobiales bacterium]|nr:hypothetical protein [Acidimicrobiales bacterium]MCB9393765.1 hypothetical protein [Acidimicrobiaceae bacterium]
MKPIALIGPAGTGKSTVGEILAGLLDRDIVDIDAVGHRYDDTVGQPVSDFVERIEVDGFRNAPSLVAAGAARSARSAHGLPDGGDRTGCRAQPLRGRGTIRRGGACARRRVRGLPPAFTRPGRVTSRLARTMRTGQGHRLDSGRPRLPRGMDRLPAEPLAGRPGGVRGRAISERHRTPDRLGRAPRSRLTKRRPAPATGSRDAQP